MECLKRASGFCKVPTHFPPQQLSRAFACQVYDMSVQFQSVDEAQVIKHQCLSEALCSFSIIPPCDVVVSVASPPASTKRSRVISGAFFQGYAVNPFGTVFFHVQE
jgi:hypothetical protein